MGGSVSLRRLRRRRCVGAIITLAPEPLYGSYLGTAEELGRDALSDQQLAGVLMWVPPSLVYAGGAAACFVGWMKRMDSSSSFTGRSG